MIKEYSIKEYRLRTKFWAMPIPDRNFDWTATFENYEGGDPIGHGTTEDEAISDLLDQIEGGPQP